MELSRINLNDREEVAAAHALLATILGASASATIHVSNCVPADTGEAQTDVGAAFAANQSQEVAAGFAANPLPAAGVPSIAGAGLLPTAQGATPGTLPGMNPAGLPMPAPAAPGAAAPTASGAATAPAPSVDVDKNGLPWDERIHAGSKNKNKDGTWKYKPGLDKSVLPVIEGELRARMGGQAPAAAPQAPLPMAAGPATMTPQPQIMQPAAGPGADPQTFEQIMPRVTAAVTSGLMPPTAIQQACAANGLASVVALQQQPAYVPLVWATLKQAYPALQ